ncbi:hypothetical protein AB0F17_44720 [Nonomuraea sp. NPDC026600]
MIDRLEKAGYVRRKPHSSSKEAIR